MSDYKEVLHERLYVRVPGTDKLRKTAAARLQHLLADGWRETERNLTADYLKVRSERTGHAPMKARLPKKGPEIRDQRRPRRDGQNFGGRGRRWRALTLPRRSFGFLACSPDVRRVSWVVPAERPFRPRSTSPRGRAILEG